jgi:hypothetical protein
VRVTISVLTFSAWTATPFDAMANDGERGIQGRRRFGRRGMQAVFQLKAFVLINLPRVDADTFPAVLI